MKKLIGVVSLLMAFCLVGCGGSNSEQQSQESKEGPKSSEPCQHAEFNWKYDSETNQHWKQCKKCKEDISEKEACTDVRDEKSDVAPTYSAEGKEAYVCSVCGHKSTKPIAKLEKGEMKIVKEWTNAETVAGYSGTPKDLVEGRKEIKFASGDSITLTFTSDKAQSVEIEINSAYKLANNSKQFFCDSDFTKDRYVITLNGQTVAQDYNNLGEAGKSCSAADVGCTEEGDFSDGSSAITKYVWVEFADLSLIQGENTIVITGDHGGYTPWISNVRLVSYEK